MLARSNQNSSYLEGAPLPRLNTLTTKAKQTEAAHVQSLRTVMQPVVVTAIDMRCGADANSIVIGGLPVIRNLETNIDELLGTRSANASPPAVQL